MSVRLLDAILSPGDHGQGPPSRARETDLKNIPGSKRAVKKLLSFEGECVPMNDERTV